MSDTARWAAWETWAERALPVDAERRSRAVKAAAQALGEGQSPQAAVVAARIDAGLLVPPAEVKALSDELQTIERVAAELRTITPSGDLTEAALAELNSRYESRLKGLRHLYESAGYALAGTAPTAGPQHRTAPPRPSLREFFTDNSILIISVAGAFLLIVATLLFEIYGASGFGDQVRFAGVLGLNLIFGAAAYVCLSRPKLRVVGQTYLALFALMVPLTVAAAWVFLTLERHGISSGLAVGIGGLGCSGLYAVLGVRLASRGYAALSLIALAVGWTGLVEAAQAGVWTGSWLTALFPAYIAIAFPLRRSPRQLVTFTRLAEPFVHAAAALAVIWSLSEAGSEWNQELLVQARPSFQLALTLGLVTAGYGMYVWRSGRKWMLWAAWVGVSATLLAAIEPAGAGRSGYVVVLVVLAWAYAAGSRWMPGRNLRAFLRIGAAAQAALPILIPSSPDGLQAGALLLAAGVGVFLAAEGGQPAWLLLAVAIFGADWYWLAKSLLPPPASPTADTLVLTYSPLPAIYGLGGLAFRLTRLRRWAWPFYVAGGLAGAVVASSAASQNDLTLAGRALMVYAGLAYVTSALERRWQGLLGALVASALAVALMLGAASAASWWYPLVMSGVAILIYGSHFVWGTSDLARTHRYAALALAGLTAASSFAVPDFWQRSSAGSLSALASVVTAAGLALIDGRLYRKALLDYVSAVVASLGAIWVARYLGVDNVQADADLPGIVLIGAGLVSPHDSRRPAGAAVGRTAVIAGAAVVMGTSAYQSVVDAAAAWYTVLWVVEAVALLLVGIGARSRTLVVAASASLALGALRALFLILESVQLYVVFGVIAILLLVGAGVLAAIRDRVAGVRSAITRSWEEWT